MTTFLQHVPAHEVGSAHTGPKRRDCLGLCIVSQVKRHDAAEQAGNVQIGEATSCSMASSCL